MAPILDRLAQEFEGELELVKVDADIAANEELLNTYDVRSIPTLVLLNGDVVISKMVGVASYPALRSWLELNMTE
jgi:thioredoxin-like negative regulator of GroEL